MKTNRPSIIRFFAMLCALLFLTGTASGSGQQQVSQDEKEAVEEIQEYSVEQKDAAVNKAKEMLDTLDQKMEAWEMQMEQKWDSLKQSSRENFASSKEEFTKQRADLSQKFDKMQNSSAAAWDEVKQGFIDGYDAFIASWNEAEKDVDKDVQ